MSTEHSQPPHGPDDFDRQLRDLTSGAAGEAKFREPSAAERAQAASRRARKLSPRNVGRARRLRQPTSPPTRSRGGPGRWRRARLRAVGGSASRRPGPSARRARLRSLAKTVGILAGFAALLLVLHLLGLGPQ